MGKQWTKYDHKLALKLHAKGQTVSQIMHALGCERTTVHAILRKHGVVPHLDRASPKAIDPKALRRLAEQGKTAAEIGTALGFTAGAVNRVAHRHRIKVVGTPMGPKPREPKPAVVIELPVIRTSRFYRPSVNWDDVPLSRSAA